MRLTESRTYFLSMGAYWLVFGLITTFYVRIMDLFQTSEGLAANTAFSNHVWFHGGLDILSLCVLLLAEDVFEECREKAPEVAEGEKLNGGRGGLLSHTEEADLGRGAQSGDGEACRQLLENNLRLAV